MAVSRSQPCVDGASQLHADCKLSTPVEGGFPATARAVARLLISLDGLRAARRKKRALKALARATRLCPQVVVEVALGSAVAAGFSLFKDGQEYGVFVGGKRIEPRTFDDASEATP